LVSTKTKAADSDEQAAQEILQLQKSSDPLHRVRGVGARKRAAIAHVMCELGNYLPEQTVSFIRSQVNTAVACKQGRRWNLHDKMFAMSFFYQSQKAYSLPQKIFFLPSPHTLQRGLQNSSARPATSIFEALQCKVQNMTDFDKDCLLMLDFTNA